MSRGLFCIRLKIIPTFVNLFTGTRIFSTITRISLSVIVSCIHTCSLSSLSRFSATHFPTACNTPGRNFVILISSPIASMAHSAPSRLWLMSLMPCRWNPLLYRQCNRRWSLLLRSLLFCLSAILGSVFFIFEEFLTQVPYWSACLLSF